MKTKSRTTNLHKNPADRFDLLRGLSRSVITLWAAILLPASSIGAEPVPDSRSKPQSEPSQPNPAERTNGEDASGKTERTAESPQSRELTDEEQEKLLASRPMTPEEVEKSGLGELQRQEDEARQKEVQRHLPSFNQLRPMLANIKDDQGVTVFEGLPHQVFEPERHAAELKAKATVVRHGFAFYQTPIVMAADDARELNALVKHPDSFSPYQALMGPGGFQPDFTLVWEVNGKPIEVQVCFSNGGEIKAYQDNVSVYCQMAEIKDPLKTLLKKHQKELLEDEK